jgi:nitroreductase
MNITQAIEQRHSTRAFTNQAVSREQIESILATARHAPSGANTQPWQVAVVTGKAKVDLHQKIEQAFSAGEKAHPDYPCYPEEWIAPYKDRRKDCGLQLFQSLDIQREDKERRLAQWAANYRAFDAPAMLLFLMDKVMQTGSYLDYGMFLQSVMLAAMGEGLATCPQAALAEYPDIIRQALDYSDDKIVICGMSLGYEDTSAAVNSYRTPREDLAKFCTFFD